MATNPLDEILMSIADQCHARGGDWMPALVVAVRVQKGKPELSLIKLEDATDLAVSVLLHAGLDIVADETGGEE